MRKLLLILALVSFVFAKDNFIYEAYAPKKIEQRLAAIEKELKLLRKYVYINKKGKVVVKESAKKTTTAKTSPATAKQIKELKRSILAINKELKRLKSSKSVTVNKTLQTKVEVLENKITKIEKAPAKNSHDSMRIDILDDKISNLEKKLNRLIVDIESDAANKKDPLAGINLEYVLIGALVIILLLLVMVLTAMSRSKEAIRKATKVADAMIKASRKKEEKKAEEVKEDPKPQDEVKDVEPVVLKTAEEPTEEAPKEKN